MTDDFTVTMWVKTTDSAGSAGAQWWTGKGLVDGEVSGGGAEWGTSIVNGKFVLGIGAASGFPTVSGRSYRVERSNTLADDSWITVEDDIPGAGNPVQVTDPEESATRDASTGSSSGGERGPSLRQRPCFVMPRNHHHARARLLDPSRQRIP